MKLKGTVDMFSAAIFCLFLLYNVKLQSNNFQSHLMKLFQMIYFSIKHTWPNRNAYST